MASESRGFAGVTAVTVGRAEIPEVRYGPWLPDPWRDPGGRLRALVCEHCAVILGRQLASPDPASMAGPVPHETALNLELVPRGPGPSGLPRYGLPKEEMAGRRPRGSGRVEFVRIGAGRFHDWTTGRTTDAIPERIFGSMPEEPVPPAKSLPAVSPSQRRRRRKRAADPYWTAGVLSYPSVLGRRGLRSVLTRPADGFPGVPGVYFTQPAVTPCEVFCPNPRCGGWHRVSGKPPEQGG